VNCLPSEPDWKIVSGGHRHAVFHVGKSVAFGLDDGSALDDRDGDAGHFLTRHLRADELVHARQPGIGRRQERQEREQEHGRLVIL
jgi:hypothetical protein